MVEANTNILSRSEDASGPEEQVLLSELMGVLPSREVMEYARKLAQEEKQRHQEKTALLAATPEGPLGTFSENQIDLIQRHRISYAEVPLGWLRASAAAREPQEYRQPTSSLVESTIVPHSEEWFAAQGLEF